MNNKCRYNNKHKFKTEEEMLRHEVSCPNREERTDLIECPYSNKHVIPKRQLERHKKTCKFREEYEKEQKKKEEEENRLRLIIESVKNTPNDNINNKSGWDEENNNYKTNHELLNDNDESDNFSDDDYIFKQCYI